MEGCGLSKPVSCHSPAPQLLSWSCHCPAWASDSAYTTPQQPAKPVAYTQAHGQPPLAAQQPAAAGWPPRPLCQVVAWPCSGDTGLTAGLSSRHRRSAASWPQTRCPWAQAAPGPCTWSRWLESRSVQRALLLGRYLLMHGGKLTPAHYCNSAHCSTVQACLTTSKSSPPAARCRACDGLAPADRAL